VRDRSHKQKVEPSRTFVHYFLLVIIFSSSARTCRAASQVAGFVTATAAETAQGGHPFTRFPSTSEGFSQNNH
jgi:hypothetical protein